jgi:hypothetical protein
MEYFEVIKIIDEKDIDHELLGFKWENDNEAIINLKNREMSFEAGGTRLIQHTDFIKGSRCIELLYDVMDRSTIEKLYKLMTGMWDDYVNPIIIGVVI